MNKILFEKIKDSLQSILPMTIIILIICLIFGVSAGEIGEFLLGAFMLIVGLVLFTLGASGSMMPLAENIGGYITKKRNLSFLIFLGFIIGFMITVSEPALWVLADQFVAIPSTTLLLAVASGVGIFVVVALLRIIFQVRLSVIFIVFYALIFTFAFFINPEFVPVAFDSGGATTGPMAVPFIMALGLGVSLTRGDKSSEEDSFGLVGVASIGPIISVLILGLIFSGGYESEAETLNLFGFILKYLFDVAVAIIPFLVFFFIFQIIIFKISRKKVIRTLIMFLYTYIGLVFFLAGANAGFVSIGAFLGQRFGTLEYLSWLLIPAGMLFGAVIVLAEPSVIVLNKQVEEVTSGAISKRAMMICMSLGVSIAIGLACIRVFTGINILWFLVPVYLTALILMFYVPKIFTAIAFDSGGAVSGAMTSTFLVPFVLGASSVIPGSNPLTDAFGLIAFVAMAPLITIQILGLIYKIKTPKTSVVQTDDEIINLTEEVTNSISENKVFVDSNQAEDTAKNTQTIIDQKEVQE